MGTTVEEKMQLNIDKSSWKLVKFGDVVFEPKAVAKNLQDEGIQHVVGLEHIDTEDIHLKRFASIEESTTFTKKFAKGDVLFGRRRAYLKKAAQAPFGGICSGDITVFRAKNDLLPALLPFVVNNDKFFDYAIKHSAGGLSPRVKFKDLASYEFLLPPKDQQAQLAELLWAMDEVMEKNIIVSLKLSCCKFSTLKKVFHRDNCDRFKVSDISINLDNKRIPTKRDKRHFGKYPYYGASGIVDYVDDFIFDEPILLISEDGDNLKSRKLPIAYSVDDKCWVNNHSHVLKISSASRYLVMEYFNFSDISDYITGGTRPKITKGALSDMPIYLPKAGLEKKSEDQLSSIDKSISFIESQIAASRALQKSLINQIF